MRVVKVFSLAKNNIPLFLKSLLLSFVIMAVSVALLAVVLNMPDLGGAKDSLSDGVRGVFSELFASRFDSEGLSQSIDSLLSTIKASLPQRLAYFYDNPSMLLALIIAAVLVWKFINGVSDLPLLKCFNSFMTTGGRQLFTWHYLKSIGKSVLFQLSYLTVTYILDISIVMATVGFYLVFFIRLGVFGVITALLLFDFLFSLRLTLFSYWAVDAAVNNSRVWTGLKNGIIAVTKNFWSNYLFTFTVISLATAGIVVSVFFISGFAGILIASFCGILSFFLIKAMNMAYYYNSTGSSYFTLKLEIEDEKID